MTMTRAPGVLSVSLNVRPSITRVRIASKYPGSTK